MWLRYILHRILATMYLVLTVFSTALMIMLWYCAMVAFEADYSDLCHNSQLNHVLCQLNVYMLVATTLFSVLAFSSAPTLYNFCKSSPYDLTLKREMVIAAIISVCMATQVIVTLVARTNDGEILLIVLLRVDSVVTYFYITLHAVMVAWDLTGIYYFIINRWWPLTYLPVAIKDATKL